MKLLEYLIVLILLAGFLACDPGEKQKKSGAFITKENDQSIIEQKEPELDPLDELIQFVVSLEDSGFFVIPQNEWHTRYEPERGKKTKYKAEDFEWNLCDYERNLFMDTLFASNIYSCVLDNQNGDVKLIAFYYASEEKLKSDYEKLKFVSRYILCTDGLKQPNQLIYKDNRAFILQTRAAAFGSVKSKLRKIIEVYYFKPPNS